MIVHQRIGRSANRRGGWIAGFFLTLAAILVLATPSFAQAPPEKADNVATKKKKQKPVSTPALGPSAASRAAAGPAPSQTSDTAQGTQAQNPLTPLWGVINENYTNFQMGPLEKTQNILIVEPVIPLKLTPDWNLVTRWNTPITYMPRLANPMGPIPGIDPDFGLSNMEPQFFFTPAHPGSFTWAVGPVTLVTDCDRQDVGNQQVGWRACRSRADDPGTFARRFPCPKHLGRESVEFARAACQFANH